MDEFAVRKHWMATLAKAELAELEKSITTLDTLPNYRFLRPPEIGLTMVRGRVGGTGEPFNLSEIPLTRCVIQLETAATPEPITGFGYVAGRSKRHAELAAVCDGLLQDAHWQAQIQTQVIAPLQASYRAKRETQSRQTEATRVNFFTLLRGES